MEYGNILWALIAKAGICWQCWSREPEYRLWVGLIATGIAIFLGTIIGVLSAYLGGWVDNVLMRFTDVMMTFPFFLLLVMIVFIFGSSLAFNSAGNRFNWLDRCSQTDTEVKHYH